jgi:predicted DNA-binding protein
MKKEFHFIMNENLFEKLEKFADNLKKSLSSTVVEIFENMIPYLEKKEISFKEKSGKYGSLGDPDAERTHVHVYLTKDLHRKLKLIHQELDYYSMAQILREIIEKYLNECFKSGIAKYRIKLVRIKNNWNVKKLRMIKMKKRIVRHLSSELSAFPLVSVTYDSFYSPCIIRFL